MRARSAGVHRAGRALLAAGLIATSASLALTPSAGAAAATTGKAYVLNGVTGETMDVSIDGRRVAGSAAPKSIVGPLTLAAGDHRITMRSKSSTAVDATFTITAGASVDLVAHRFPDAERAPTVTAYDNDMSPTEPGKARLLVAHTAVVPPADILVNDAVLIRNIANGESSTQVVPAGSYKVAIVPTLTTGPAVLGPTTLKVRAGTLTNVFAVGDPAAGTMDAIVQEFPIRTTGAGVPSSVDTGDGGQAAALFAADRTSTAATSLELGTAAVLALLLTGLLVRGGPAVVGGPARAVGRVGVPRHRR